MPTYSEQRKLPYTALQMFDLVADVEKYGEFLPWCIACRKTKDDDDIIEADIIIGYKLIREKFTSRVTLTKHEFIHVEYLSGPMKNLSNHWKFIPDGDGCIIDFYVDFEFKNPLLQGLITMFFDKAIKKMVGAFEKRAQELYSDK